MFYLGRYSTILVTIGLFVVLVLIVVHNPNSPQNASKSISQSMQIALRSCIAKGVLRLRPETLAVRMAVLVVLFGNFVIFTSYR